MIESLAKDKFKQEREKIENIDNLSLQEIRKSTLLPFVKKFILVEAEEIINEATLNTLIAKAIKLDINYTLRPKWTLINYLFVGADSKNVNEILRKVKIFQFYSYYTDLITDFINDISISHITNSKVRELIDEVNSVLYEKLTTDVTSIKIRNFFLQIFKLKYQQNSDITLSSSIPFQYLRLFLEDKSFEDISEKFHVVDRISDGIELDLKTIIKVLTDKYSTSFDEHFPLEEIRETIEVKKQEVLDIDIEKELPIKEKDIIDIDLKDKKTAEESVYSKDLLQAKRESIKVEKAKEDKPQKIKPELTDTSKQRIPVLSKSHVSEKDVLPQKTERIKRLFKKDELFHIAKKVFRSSKLSMYQSFNELEEINSWEEATGFLKAHFAKNNVDLYHKDVVLFIDVLNEYFTRKERRV
ncbi:MAG: hypothetical protein H8D45_30540 [Bacteroidetes bacterium]|nr:hypothetical protein [Bacteroidota bacterium]